MLNPKRICPAVAAVAISLSAAFENRAQAAFAEGDFITYTQGIWGGTPSGNNPPALLMINYASLYTSGVLEVGIPSTAGNSIRFVGPSRVLAYLPGIGPPGTLSIDHVDPLVTEAGVFGGEVVALTLNIDFADAGHTLGNLGIPFGDLELHGFRADLWLLNGLTVREFLAQANTVLGGGLGIYSMAKLYPLTNSINVSFGNATVQPFAQDHLRVVVDMRGDFNQDGTVDAADYVVWRKSLGQFGSGLPADANDDGQVNATDYGIWRGNFGNSAAPSGAGATAGLSSTANAVVPEPTAAALALLALLGLACRRNRARHQC